MKKYLLLIIGGFILSATQLANAQDSTKRAGMKDLRKDIREKRKDQRELKREIKEGDKQGAKAEVAEIRADRKDIKEDAKDLKDMGVKHPIKRAKKEIRVINRRG